MQAAVITFDHLAYRFLACYGNPSFQTPHFDALAAECVVFDQCYGVAGADPAFPGLRQVTESVRASGGCADVLDCGGSPSGDPDLVAAISEWKQAAQRDVPALLWIRHPGPLSPWCAPAERIVAAWQANYPADDLPRALRECGIESVDANAPPATQIANALPQLTRLGCLSRDQHAPTLAVGRLRRSVYAAVVMTLDGWLGEVRSLLNVAGQPDTLLIVSAAAGDLTGPHAGLSAGGPPLIDPCIHVPLLIRTGTPADGTRRNGLVSTADLAPTLAELFHVQHPGDDRSASRSLWPLLNDESQAVRDALLIGAPDVGWSLRTSEFACLCDPLQETGDESADGISDRARLFVKPDDAWETLNVARQYPAVTAEYCRRIHDTARGSADAV